LADASESFYEIEKKGIAASGLCRSGVFRNLGGAKIAIQRRSRRVQHNAAIAASLQVAFDFKLHALGEFPL
jgi:hypothetical protein